MKILNIIFVTIATAFLVSCSDKSMLVKKYEYNCNFKNEIFRMIEDNINYRLLITRDYSDSYTFIEKGYLQTYLFTIDMTFKLEIDKWYFLNDNKWSLFYYEGINDTLVMSIPKDKLIAEIVWSDTIKINNSIYRKLSIGSNLDNNNFYIFDENEGIIGIFFNDDEWGTRLDTCWRQEIR